MTVLRSHVWWPTCPSFPRIILVLELKLVYTGKPLSPRQNLGPAVLWCCEQGYVDTAKKEHSLIKTIWQAMLGCCHAQCPQKPKDLDYQPAYRTGCLVSSIPKEPGDLDCFLAYMTIDQVPTNCAHPVWCQLCLLLSSTYITAVLAFWA